MTASVPRTGSGSWRITQLVFAEFPQLSPQLLHQGLQRQHSQTLHV